ncbi:MAG: ribose 5-phosphate isomerase A [Candidatus Acidiferrales bacterium]
MNTLEQDRQKQSAAEAAAQMVQDRMVLGLGSGSTAAMYVAALGRRVAQEGLRVIGIPTSESTAAQARGLRIPLTTFAEHGVIDLTIDGADEVEPGSLALIKGHGGALLREKIVAAASKRMIVVADTTKIVEHLGSRETVPVEVVPFGWEQTLGRLGKLGAKVVLRLKADGTPYVTDGGHYIINCGFGAMANPREVASELDHVVGVVEHGIFIGYATDVIVGGKNGVTEMHRTAN